MLRLRVEHLPKGFVHDADLIGELVITNDGTGDSVLGNYDVIARMQPGKVYTTRVTDFPRDADAWALIQEALQALREDA